MAATSQLLYSVLNCLHGQEYHNLNFQDKIANFSWSLPMIISTVKYLKLDTDYLLNYSIWYIYTLEPPKQLRATVYTPVPLASTLP